MTISVLFVCIHNSARSQMAEAFVNHLFGDRFGAQSAGLEPGKLNEFAVAAMRERGIDIAGHATKSVFDTVTAGARFDYVVTVCDEASAERCPSVAGKAKRMHWGFSDPSSFIGTDEERLAKTRTIRDQIEAKVKAWCTSAYAGTAADAGKP